MLQLSNSCLEWRNYNTFWEGIPLHNSQRKEGVFIGILASVNLTKCHWMAVPGYPMSGLGILGKGHGHEAIPNFVKETETGHRSFLFKCLPAQLVQQWSDAGCSGIIIHGPLSCTSLNHFNLMGILLGVGVPYSWSVLKLGTDKGLVLINPRELLAFEAILFTWMFQLKLLMSIPNDRLQNLAMKYVSSVERGSGRSHMYNLALGGVELHVPL